MISWDLRSPNKWDSQNRLTTFLKKFTPLFRFLQILHYFFHMKTAARTSRQYFSWKRDFAKSATSRFSFFMKFKIRHFSLKLAVPISLCRPHIGTFYRFYIFMHAYLKKVTFWLFGDFRVFFLWEKRLKKGLKSIIEKTPIFGENWCSHIKFGMLGVA